MTPFEYLTVLISIILGLGITTILAGIAELIKQSSLSSLYPPYLIWIVLVFVLHIQEWWVTFALQSEPEWTLPKFLFILLYPINLYVLAHLLFPAGVTSAFSSKEFYLSNFPRLFAGAIVLALLSIAHNLHFLDLQLYQQVPQAIVLIVLSAMVWMRTRSNIIHLAVSFLFLALLVASLAVEQQTLR